MNAMEKLLQRQAEKMAHPPKDCERCHKPMDKYDRYWESHSGQWICGECDWKVVPA